MVSQVGEPYHEIRRFAARSADIVLWVSPHLGLVDSWMPILRVLKARDPEISICAVFLSENLISQFRPGDILSELAQCTFDWIVTENGDGVWHLYPSMESARRFLCGRQSPQIFPAMPPVAISPQELLKNTKAVLFDLAEAKRRRKHDMGELAALARNAIWFSLPHGIDLRTWKYGNDDPRRNFVHNRKGIEVIAYAASEGEIPAYVGAFGITTQQARVVGVPRHDRSWIEHIKRYSRSSPKFGSYVLLASRPAHPVLFPASTKLKLLQDIRRMAVDDLGLRIVVRRHPREEDLTLFSLALGLENYGRTWMFSAAHALHLGDRAEFCISMFSSVAVDMAVIGVPVIEMFRFSEMSGLPQLLNGDGGRPASVYRKLKLVLGAGDYEELRDQVASLMEDRHSLVGRAKSAYAEFYHMSDDPIARVADEVWCSLGRV